MKRGDIPITNPMRGDTPINRVMRGDTLIWERGTVGECTYLYMTFATEEQETDTTLTDHFPTTDYMTSSSISADGKIASQLVWRYVPEDTYEPFKVNISLRITDTPFNFSDIDNLPHTEMTIIETNESEYNEQKYHVMAPGCVKLWSFSSIRGGIVYENSSDCEYAYFTPDGPISFDDFGAGEYQRSPYITPDGMQLFVGMTGIGGSADRARIYCFSPWSGTPWNFYSDLSEDYYIDLYDKSVGEMVKQLQYFYFVEEGNGIVVGYTSQNDNNEHIFYADLSSPYDISDWSNFQNIQNYDSEYLNPLDMLETTIPNTVDGDCINRLYANAWEPDQYSVSYRMELGKEDTT